MDVLTVSLLAIGGIIGLSLLAYPYIKFPAGPRYVLATLLILLPFHTIVFQILNVELGVSPALLLLLQSWKELFVFALLLWVLARALLQKTIHISHPGIFLLCCLFIASGFTSLLMSPQLLSALYGFRGTFTPFVVLALILCLPIDFRWLQKIVPVILTVGVIVAIFAAYQSLVLGYSFLWRYYAQDGILSNSFSFMGGDIQRAMGTFSSPNQLSLYLVFLILIAVNWLMRSRNRLDRYLLAGAAVIMLIALLLTVSRSGWVALMIGGLVSFVMWRNKGRYFLLLSLSALVIIPLALFFELDSHLLSTFQGKEISANYRFSVTAYNLEIIRDNPLGVGLGTVGARAARFATMATKTYRTESYLLQLVMEVGIPGFLLFVSLMIGIMIGLYRSLYTLHLRFSRGWTVAALSCMFAAFGHALFIPDFQDFTLGFYLCFIVGVGLRLEGLERMTENQSQRAVGEAGIMGGEAWTT